MFLTSTPTAHPIKRKTTTMKAITVISNKKTDGETIAQPKENNYMIIETKYANAAKYMLYIQALLGINRLNLISSPKIVRILAYVYSLGFILFTVGLLVKTASTMNLFVYLSNNIIVIEYVALVFLSYSAGNEMLRSQIKRVSTFCEMLKVNDLAIVAASFRNACGSLAICAVCNIFELCLINNLNVNNIPYVIYRFIIRFTHDFELVLVIAQVRNIYLRIVVIKAHVERMFGDGKKRMQKLNTFEKASLKAELDIETLHKTFALMDKCSRKFNSHMNIPVRALP